MDNYFTDGISGKIGDKVFKRNKLGNSYICDLPDFSNVIDIRQNTCQIVICKPSCETGIDLAGIGICSEEHRRQEALYINTVSPYDAFHGYAA